MKGYTKRFKQWRKENPVYIKAIEFKYTRPLILTNSNLPCF